MVFRQKLLEKAHFVVQMTGLAMVRPANSYFCKAPLDSKVTGSPLISLQVHQTVVSVTLICLGR